MYSIVYLFLLSSCMSVSTDSPPSSGELASAILQLVRETTIGGYGTDSTALTTSNLRDLSKVCKSVGRMNPGEYLFLRNWNYTLLLRYVSDVNRQIYKRDLVHINELLTAVYQCFPFYILKESETDVRQAILLSRNVYDIVYATSQEYKVEFRFDKLAFIKFLERKDDKLILDVDVGIETRQIVDVFIFPDIIFTVSKGLKQTHTSVGILSVDEFIVRLPTIEDFEWLCLSLKNPNQEPGRRPIYYFSKDLYTKRICKIYSDKLETYIGKEGDDSLSAKQLPDSGRISTSTQRTLDINDFPFRIADKTPPPQQFDQSTYFDLVYLIVEVAVVVIVVLIPVMFSRRIKTCIRAGKRKGSLVFYSAPRVDEKIDSLIRDETNGESSAVLDGKDAVYDSYKFIHGETTEPDVKRSMNPFDVQPSKLRADVAVSPFSIATPEKETYDVPKRAVFVNDKRQPFTQPRLIPIDTTVVEIRQKIDTTIKIIIHVLYSLLPKEAGPSVTDVKDILKATSIDVARCRLQFDGQVLKTTDIEGSVNIQLMENISKLRRCIQLISDVGTDEPVLVNAEEVSGELGRCAMILDHIRCKLTTLISNTNLSFLSPHETI